MTLPTEVLPAPDARVEPVEERWEWLEHLVPLQFLRVLWNALFPSRFRTLVLEGLDGHPPAGYARPLTFCLGCWLLLFGVAQALPWAFHVNSIGTVLATMPAADRHALAARLGIDTIPGVVIRDSGEVSFGGRRRAVVARLHTLVGKRAGRVSAEEIARYLELHGDAELGLRVRGYSSRFSDRQGLFDEATLVVFVVFGLVPGWWVSHRVLGSRRRTVRETRAVHMYNDSWLLVACIVPLSTATYCSEAFASPWPQRVLAVVGAAGLLVWLVRTPRLFRVTHGAPAWRVGVAHVLGLAVALVMVVVFAVLSAIVHVSLDRAGF